MAEPIDYQYIQRALKARQTAQQFQEQQARQAETARIKAKQLEGQQEYDRLVASGVPPEQALRRTAGKLYYNNPAGLASALRVGAPEPEMRMPIPTNYHGKPYMLTPSRYGYSPMAVPPERPAPAFKPPPEAAAQQKMIEAEMGALRSDIVSREKAALGIPTKKSFAMTNMVPEMRDRLKALSSEYVEAARPAPSTQTTSGAGKKYGGRFQEGDTIQDKRTGKVYRIENGKLVPAQ